MFVLKRLFHDIFTSAVVSGDIAGCCFPLVYETNRKDYCFDWSVYIFSYELRWDSKRAYKTIGK